MNIWTRVFAYNTSSHESSLHTPFEVMFGRKAVIPIELTYLDPGSQLLSNYTKSSESVVPVNIMVLCILYTKLYLVYILTYVITILFLQIDFVGGLNQHRQEILERMEKNISIAQKRQKTAYDRKHANPCKFQVGASMHLNNCRHVDTCFIVYIPQVGMEVLQKDFRRCKRKGGKMDPKWLSPSLITHALGKGFYSLVTLDQKKIVTKRINGAHLKLYLRPPSSPHQSTPPASPHLSHPLTCPHHQHPLISTHHHHLLTCPHHLRLWTKTMKTKEVK